MKLRRIKQSTDRTRFRHGKQWDCAAHRCDTVERKPLARHLGRLLPILLHHFHAIGGHHASRHSDHRHARATGKRRLLTEQTTQCADQQEQGEEAFHDQVNL